jgi:cell division cycle protein 20 (cofactor of APC complex)
MRYSNHASIIPDPYLQDPLRVLNRTYGRKNITASTSSPMDTIAMEEATLRSVAKKIGRKISTVPIRILDAPNLVDDYYLNLVSWSLDNILAVALGQSVYLWYAATEQIDHLLTLTGSDDYVTSVCWCNQDGNTNYIAVGTNDSTVQLWDASTLQKLRTLKGHSARVGSLAWNRQHWLSSGSRDSSIIQHDVRVSQNRVATYIGHTQEVCGLKWSYDGSTLASGGNENFLCLWDASMSSANMRSRQLPSRNTSSSPHDLITTVSARVTLTQHKAAVKALAWCPFHRGLLASGGGTADVSEPNVS